MRRIIQELYLEYHSVLRQRRLRLRPAAIQIDESESRWGSWNSLTRTISLSRRLIEEHPWFQVVGILRHEMAHQWVDEAQPPHHERDLPHGERFRQACQILGVPEEFSRASTDLQSRSLDWRAEKRDETSEKLLDRVRKLLALATSSNEHEALLAMNKVRELYAKYNLKQAPDKEEGSRHHFAHLVITHGKQRIETHQRKIIGILVGYFFVQVVTFRMFDAKTGGYHSSIELIGTRENVLMAEYVYHFLGHQTDFLVREAARKASSPLTRTERKSYRLGILEGFAEKLAGPSPGSTEPGTNLSLITQAVAKFRQDQQLSNYLAEIYPRLKRSRTSWQEMDDLAFDAGREAGRALTLRKAVTERERNLGRMLPSSEPCRG